VKSIRFWKYGLCSPVFKHVQAYPETKLSEVLPKIRASGLTALYAALQSAFEIAQKSRLPGWIVLLTDGEPTDVTKPEQYSKLKMPTGFQMIEFGIGADYNQSILKALADASGGMLHNITDAQKLKLPSLMQESAVNEVGARKHKCRLGSPEVKILNYKGPPVSTRCGNGCKIWPCSNTGRHSTVDCSTFKSRTLTRSMTRKRLSAPL